MAVIPANEGISNYKTVGSYPLLNSEDSYLRMNANSNDSHTLGIISGKVTF